MTSHVRYYFYPFFQLISIRVGVSLLSCYIGSDSQLLI